MPPPLSYEDSATVFSVFAHTVSVNDKNIHAFYEDLRSALSVPLNETLVCDDFNTCVGRDYSS